MFFPNNSWNSFLTHESKQAYFHDILVQLANDKNNNKTIYPPADKIFAAYALTPIENIKVVILGQDPYHGENQANGLAFSVTETVKIPPSLRNIYKELNEDIPNFTIPKHGSLINLAKQGVFLLNSSLTVRASEPASHAKIGWQTLTDRTIKYINQNCSHTVFILWGKHAEQKKHLIDIQKHNIIKSAHPSPLSAHRGFWGSKPFSKTNQYLINNGIAPINWQV